MAARGEVRHSTFAKVIVIVLAVIAGLGVLIHFANAGHHRPEGAAERWLAAVSDTERRGLSVDARKRAPHIRPLALAPPLLPPKFAARPGPSDPPLAAKALLPRRDNA